MDRASVALFVSLVSALFTGGTFLVHYSNWRRGGPRLRVSATRPIMGPVSDRLVVTVYNSGATEETVVGTGVISGKETFPWREEPGIPIARNEHKDFGIPAEFVRDKLGTHLKRGASCFATTASGKTFKGKLSEAALLTWMENNASEARSDRRKS